MEPLKNKYFDDDIYTTPDGVQLLREWKFRDWVELNRRATLAAKYMRQICIFKHGEPGRSASEAFGLPYTSSSAYAAIWNTNAEAVDPRGRYFRGVAIDPDGVPVIVWNEYDENGDELPERFEPFAAWLLWRVFEK